MAKLRAKRPPETIALPRVRVLAGLTQGSVATKLGWTQQSVSELERSRSKSKKKGELSSPTVETLRRYIAACGGELEIRVRLGDDEYVLEDPAETGRKRQEAEAALPHWKRAAFRQRVNRVFEMYPREVGKQGTDR